MISSSPKNQRRWKSEGGIIDAALPAQNLDGARSSWMKKGRTSF